ncbi:MAG TPA: hypothetical protein VH352_00320 [Pseudonocardiaceae bacterium]|jgi:hypothetical protein|nr:hypothetical protein [Pseudonocardiaceae bacterium]
MAVTLLYGSLIGANAHATPDAATAAAAANQSSAPASDPGRDGRIAVLKAALANIQASLAAGKNRFGAVDLRDIFSYKVNQLWTQGIDGFGTTVAVMEGWDLPSMQARLNTLDAAIGLPDTTVETIFPTGPLPAVCPPGMVALGSFGSCDAWGGELALDVEAVHLMAPYAKIVISATPSDSEVVGDPSSEVAMPEIMKGLEFIAANKLANVASISDGSSETDYLHGAPEIRANDPGELAAAAAGIPVTVATGDCGSSQNLTTATKQCGSLSAGPASATWDDSPFVTAVGGSRPTHTAPCPPCTGPNNEDVFPLDPIEGAGLSEIYARPDYQNHVRSITGSSMRAVPDITMNSRDGTSESAPLFAGVLALATQIAGHNIGTPNELLYDRLSHDPQRNGIVDVTSGDDHIGTIPGFTAVPGYDVASGWGTVDASLFAPALARMSHENPMPRQAAEALEALRHTMSLTPSSTVAAASPVDVMSSGFLPDHPVTIAVDGTKLVTVIADTSGNINFAFVPTTAGIAAGRHTVHITSMLIDQDRTLTVTS